MDRHKKNLAAKSKLMVERKKTMEMEKELLSIEGGSTKMIFPLEKPSGFYDAKETHTFRSVQRDRAQLLLEPFSDGGHNMLKYNPHFQSTDRKIPYENMKFNTTMPSDTFSQTFKP